jgi:hypothetical protein
MHQSKLIVFSVCFFLSTARAVPIMPLPDKGQNKAPSIHTLSTYANLKKTNLNMASIMTIKAGECFGFMIKGDFYKLDKGSAQDKNDNPTYRQQLPKALGFGINFYYEFE